MKKDLNWTLIWIGVVLGIVLVMVVLGVIWDKNDWIFLVLVLGIIMLNWKLNKILRLLEKKKK